MTTSDWIQIAIYSFGIVFVIAQGVKALIDYLKKENLRLEKKALDTKLDGLSDQNTGIKESVEKLTKKIITNEQKDAVIAERVNQNTEDIKKHDERIRDLELGKTKRKLL